MHISSISLFTVAAPPIVGSFIVLALADVGWGIWGTHLVAIFLACGLAMSGALIKKAGHCRFATFAIVILTLIGLAISLLGESSEPERWMSVGPLMLYAAPLFLPSFIAACSVFVSKDGKHQIVSLAVVIGAALILSFQPDASQVLGLLVASVVVVMQFRLGIFKLSLVVVPMLLITVWVFSLPDPLAPVPYVEEVFALGLSHSLFAGIAIIVSAIALVVGLWIKSMKGPLWLSAVAAYYASLFACSIAGLTPAPLVGYGAGPILGFGLMLGTLRCLEPQLLPNNPIQPTANVSAD